MVGVFLARDWILAVDFGMSYLLIALAVLTLLAGARIAIRRRELRDRFGEEYIEYCRRVPRFVPRRAARRA
jgi:protein-S-isoprenylcysteine O-methyltransferase Ste14